MDIQSVLSCKEAPLTILERMHSLRGKNKNKNKIKVLVKVEWQNRRLEESTWEIEEDIEAKYLEIFN